MSLIESCWFAFVNILKIFIGVAAGMGLLISFVKIIAKFVYIGIDLIENNQKIKGIFVIFLTIIGVHVLFSLIIGFIIYVIGGKGR